MEGKVIRFPSLPPPVQPAEILDRFSEIADVEKQDFFFHPDTRHLFVEVGTTNQAERVVEHFSALRAHISNRRSVHAPHTRVLMLAVTDPSENTLSCDALRDWFVTDPSQVRRIQLLGPAAQSGGREQAARAQIRGFVEFETVEAAEYVLENLQGRYRQDIGTLTLTTSRQEFVTVKEKKHGKDYTNGEGEGKCPPTGVGAMQTQSMPGDGGQCVVLVSNLPLDITVDMLFRLFGTVGDVIAVKILFAKRSEALVQFRCPEHAQAASRLLRGTPLYNSGKDGIRVVPARNPKITGPADNLTHYWESPCSLHRFAGVQHVRALKHRCQPTQRLHVANIPLRTPARLLPEIVSQVAEATSVRWLQRSAGEDRSRQALISFPSVRCAVAALVGLHTYEIPNEDLPGGRGLVVSFSAQGERTEGQAPAHMDVADGVAAEEVVGKEDEGA